MSGDQQAQLEQLETHIAAVRNDLNAALAKKHSPHILRALNRLDDVECWARVGVLE